MIRILFVFLLSFGAFSIPSSAWSETNTAEAKKDSGYGAPSAAAQSETAAALEDLRYKHLWIAYALIWLTVFLFMYRTYKIGHQNRDQLDALRSRLGDLEQKNG